MGGGGSDGSGLFGGVPGRNGAVARVGGGPTGVMSERWAPKGGGTEISRFFPPTTIFALFVSFWGSSRGILVVFEAQGPSKCARLEFSGCRVKPPRPQSREGYVLLRPSSSWAKFDLGQLF